MAAQKGAVGGRYLYSKYLTSDQLSRRRVAIIYGRKTT